MINKRLFDWYGIDTGKNLQFPKLCSRPFDTVLIDKMGSCYLCECTAWLPQSVGNLNVNPLKEILDSPLAKTLQQSILDKSYKYCNSKQCTFLQNYSQKHHHPVPKKEIKHIRLAIDDSCNLHCPSCRKEKIFIKSGKLLHKRFELVDKILNFIKEQKQEIKVHIGSDGDPYASLVYRRFMTKTKNLSNIKYSLQTNGLLIKKNFYKFKHITDNLFQIGISIDGATKLTYEKLRRGGSFEKIIENLDFLKKIKKEFSIHLHMVVQQENWKEMPHLLELGKKFNVDKIFFNTIQDWNTGLNFSQQTFLNDDNYKFLLKNLQKDNLVFNPEELYPVS